MEITEYSEVASQMPPLEREVAAGFLKIQLRRYEELIDAAKTDARTAVYYGIDRETAWKEVHLLRELRDGAKERIKLLNEMQQASW